VLLANIPQRAKDAAKDNTRRTGTTALEQLTRPDLEKVFIKSILPSKIALYEIRLLKVGRASSRILEWL
jgi:hypothetical protein